MDVASIILAILGFVMGLTSLLFVVNIQGKFDVAVELLRACLETKEISKVTEQSRRTNFPTYASDESATVRRGKTVPSTSPKAIAPKLQSPPKIRGGFGQKTTNSDQEKNC